MTEEFLHHIWKFQLFDKENLSTKNGEKVEVILPGMHNTDSGPDFSNARIKIDNTIWVGNVEIHKDESDWRLHQHQLDKAYNNVILHVVARSNSKVFTQNGKEIPTLVLNYDTELFENYIRLKDSPSDISCVNDLSAVSDITWSSWFDRLSVERLETKTDRIQEGLTYTNNNWEEAFYIFLARSFGFKTNSLPMEILARTTPLKVVSKYSNNLFQLEALLLGQAGFLNEEKDDEYFNLLRKEYNYIRKIHQLNPMEAHLWKFMRLRPVNFPTIRIAQFAALIFGSKRLFSKIIEVEKINQLQILLKCKASKYWDTHYTFGQASEKRSKQLGSTAINGLIINSILPFMFLFGKESAKPYLSDKAISFLELLPSENNSIITKWKACKVKCATAFESQALLQLYNVYCIKKNCLYCKVGNQIILNRTT